MTAAFLPDTFLPILLSTDIIVTDTSFSAVPIPETAMVLAAGFGTRLRPLTETTPKAMVKVLGRPMIDVVLDRLRDAGVKRAVVNLHHLGHVIRDHLQDRHDLEIVFSQEDEILETCRELGIAITAYGVLSRGLIGGHMQGAPDAAGDYRNFTPRFQGENLTRNLALAEALRTAAAAHGLTPAQAAIGWVAAQGPDIFPLIGARTRARLTEALGAIERPLSPEALAGIEAAAPKGSGAGERYPAPMMAHLDSERRASA